MSGLPLKGSYGTGYGPGKADNTEAYLWKPVLQQLASLAPGSYILDSGCGNGYFAKQLRDLGFHVAGLDQEESAIFHARKLCPDIRFEVASVYDEMQLLFGRRFDAVVALEVIEHLYDPRKYVRRVRDCLCPNGKFVLSTPYHGYLKNLVIALGGRFDAHVAPLWNGGHIKFWSRKTLTRLLEEEDFQVDAFVGAGRMPYLWKSMILAGHRR